MSVRLFYVDESYDDSRFCLTAIAIRHSEWRVSLDEIVSHRASLREEYGMFSNKEIHARDLVAGRGQIGNQEIGKWKRSRIFRSVLQLVARLPDVQIFNVCLDKSKYADPQLTAWDRILNRIERTMLEFENREIPLRQSLCDKTAPHLSEDELQRLKLRLMSYHARAVIISDEGRERELSRTLRKMHVLNFIPSRYGNWNGGQRAKNIAVERVIEDPVFRDSARSYFIQLADCVSFALLKREVAPTPRISKYGIHKMFEECLSGVCFKKACPSDPLGIVRK